MVFGALSKWRVPEDLFRSWIGPPRQDPRVRRDLTKYLTNVLKPDQLLAWADQQPTFIGPVLIIRPREDKHAPHPRRTTRRALPEHQLVWIYDSRTLIHIDQPAVLTDHLRTFLAANPDGRRGHNTEQDPALRRPAASPVALIWRTKRIRRRAEA